MNLISMNIDLSKLHYTFQKKPILVGGKAMEYYGLRKAGSDIDFIADEKDVVELIRLYPHRVKDLWGDLGVCPFEFEIWRTIVFFDYTYFLEDAIKQDEYFIVSLEKLLFMKTLGMKKEKYLNDVKLITENIIDQKYKDLEKEMEHNSKLLEGVNNISYIEKTRSYFLNSFPSSHGVPRSGRTHLSSPTHPATRQARIKNNSIKNSNGLVLIVPAKR